MAREYLGQYIYRNIKVDLYNDDKCQQIVACILPNDYFETFEIGLGAFNFTYKEDLHALIDQKLDNIYDYDGQFSGASLEWFDNAGFRDIKLIYKNRVLKI